MFLHVDGNALGFLISNQVSNFPHTILLKYWFRKSKENSKTSHSKTNGLTEMCEYIKWHFSSLNDPNKAILKGGHETEADREHRTQTTHKEATNYFFFFSLIQDQGMESEESWPASLCSQWVGSCDLASSVALRQK